MKFTVDKNRAEFLFVCDIEEAAAIHTALETFLVSYQAELQSSQFPQYLKADAELLLRKVQGMLAVMPTT